MTEISTWPPVYKITKHPRAKRIKLAISKQHGLRITVPDRFRMSDVLCMLENHKNWILEKLHHYQPFQALALPTTIELAAIQENWRVTYMACQFKVRLMYRPHQEIVLFGKVDDKLLCKKLLMRWLKKMAQRHLLTQLQHISDTLALPFSSSAVRGQQTRWGSCSAAKAINLNYKLLFLPTQLVRHVLIHELCHTKHLNHSTQFWQLVAKHDVNWETHRRALAKADHYVPGWAV